MFVLPFLEISVIACVVAYIFKQSFAKVLPASLFLIVVLMYFSGIIGDLRIGVYAILAISLIAIIYFITRIAKNDEDMRMRIAEILASPGFVIFIILYFAIFIYNINASFSFWDEWSHWGMYIKDMTLRNKFYNTAGHIATTHISYPPFIQLFEYWYAKVVGVTNMQNIYRSNQILCYSLPICVFGDLKFDKETIFENIKIVAVMILSVLYFILVYRIIDFQSNPIKSIYGDAFLGISFGYFMVNVLKFDFDDRFKIFNIILSGIALVFSKQMGTALFLLGIFILFMMTVISKSLTKDKFIKGLIIFIIPMLFFASWKVIVFANSVQDQFDLTRKMDIPELLSILFKGGGVEWQRTVISNFVSWIFNTRILGIKVFDGFLLLVVLFIVFSHITRKEYKIKVIVLSIGLLIGLCLYMFGLLCLYLYTFSEYEGTRLASIWRYASTYIIGLFFVIGYALLDVMIYKKRMNIISVLCLCVVLVGLIMSIHFSKVINYMPKAIESSDDYIFKDDFQKMEALPSDSKILIISQGDQGLTGARFKFKFFDKNFASCSFGDRTYHDPDVWTKNLTKEEFGNYIKDFDYIYFYNVDDNFISHYGDLFNKDVIKKGHVYKIEEILKV